MSKFYFKLLAQASVIVPVISLLISIIFLIDFQVGLVAIVFSISLIILILGLMINMKYRVLTLSVGFFVLFNFLVFPLIHVSILKNDPTAYAFPSETLNREYRSAFSEYSKSVDTIDTYKRKSFLSGIYTQEHVRLNELLIGRQERLIATESALIVFRRHYIYRHRARSHRPDGMELAFFRPNGEFECRFELHGRQLDSALRLKDQIGLEIKFLSNRLYVERKKGARITEEKNFWTYQKILGYALSMIAEGHIQPISKTANICLPVHRIVVGFFILNIIFLGMKSIVLDS